MRHFKLKQPTFLTIFTEEPWVDYLYDVLLSIDNQTNFSFDQDKILNLDEILTKCFNYFYDSSMDFYYLSLNIISLLDWAKTKINDLNDPSHSEEDKHKEHIKLTNCVIALFMVVTSHTKVSDNITAISLELPDVIHVTVQ